MFGLRSRAVHISVSKSNSTSADAAVVSTIDIFSELSLQDRRLIADKMHLRNYDAGQFILSNASAGRNVFFLISGTVRVCAYSANGKQVQFEDLHVGQMFGEIAALDGGVRSSDCIAFTSVVVATLSYSDFCQCLNRHADVNLAVLRRLTALIRRQMARVIEFSTAPVATRLRYELLRLASANDGGNATIVIENPPTHADIAARISTHREAVTREVGKLEKADIVSWTRGRCVIHDINALTKIGRDSKSI